LLAFKQFLPYSYCHPKHRVLKSNWMGSVAHPASYPMGIGSSFPWGKAAGAWSWPFTSI